MKIQNGNDTINLFGGTFNGTKFVPDSRQGNSSALSTIVLFISAAACGGVVTARNSGLASLRAPKQLQEKVHSRIRSDSSYSRCGALHIILRSFVVVQRWYCAKVREIFHFLVLIQKKYIAKTPRSAAEVNCAVLQNMRMENYEDLVNIG